MRHSNMTRLVLSAQTSVLSAQTSVLSAQTSALSAQTSDQMELWLHVIIVIIVSPQSDLES